MEWDGRVVYQSQRSDAYHHALHELRRRGALYACACSRREIADSASRASKATSIRARAATARRRRDARGRGACAPAARASRSTTASKRVSSRTSKRRSAISCCIAPTGFIAYQLAVVVDDAEQGITDVVRGADLIDSTPRQIFLQELLRLPSPRYAHVPVAVNARGEKLSKQTHAAPVSRHDPATALYAVLDFLGQSPPAALARATTRELWSWAIPNWRIDRVPRVRSRLPKVGQTHFPV